MEGGIVYMTKTMDNPLLTGRFPLGRSYFLGRFFGFALGVCGSGGLFSIVRSRSFVRFFTSAAGRKSILAISAARSTGVSVFMVGV